MILQKHAKNLFSAIMLSATALLGAVSPSVFAEPMRPGVDETSFFERYTNGAQELVLKGLELVGIGYKFGGTNPDIGLDCSGFVQVVFRDSLGKLLPRTAIEQSNIGKPISANELKPGDLVFFNTMRRAFSHVGIYLGNNQFMHAPRTGAEIRVEDMSKSYWVSRYNGARRVLDGEQ